MRAFVLPETYPTPIMPSTGRKTRRVYVVGNSLPKMSCKPLPLGKFARLEYKQEVGAGMRSRTHLSGSKHSLASLGRHSPRILTQMSTPPHSPPISKRTCTRSHTRTTSPKAAPAFSPLPADTCGSTSGMVTKPAAATTPAERLRKVVVKVKAVVRFKGLDLDNREQQELAKIQDIVDRAELKRDMAVEDVRQGLTRTEELLRQKFSAALKRLDNMKRQLMEDAKLGAYGALDGRRADSVLAGAPVVDQLRGPTDDEQWQLGVDIVNLQNRLNKIARGGAAPDLTSHLALPNYPAQQPPKPTWKSIVQKYMHVLAESRSLMVKAKFHGLLPGLSDHTKPGASTSETITQEDGVPAAGRLTPPSLRPYPELKATEAMIKHLQLMVKKSRTKSSVKQGSAPTTTTTMTTTTTTMSTTTNIGSAEVPILITQFSTQFSTQSSFGSQQSCEV